MDVCSLKLNDDEEKDEPKPMLKLITGGGTEPPQKSGIWLQDLEIGTVFFVQNAKNAGDFSLQLFRLEGLDGEGYRRVACIRSPALPNEVYVDPVRFSNQFSLHHTVGVRSLSKEPEDVEDNRVAPATIEEKKTVE